MFSIEPSRIGRIVIPPALPPGVAVFYTTRDFPGRITDDIVKAIRERFGIDASLNTCRQVHGATVQAARGQGGECDSCDALFTVERRVALAIKVADCLPVTIADPQRGVLANIHSGWRGTVQKITAATLDTLERDTPFGPGTALAWLGPSIRVCCFEVGEEVAAQFDGRYVDRSHPKPHVDIAAVTGDLLRNRGFSEANIFDSGLCTRCEGSIFHSFRRDGSGGGRNLAIAGQ